MRSRDGERARCDREPRAAHPIFFGSYDWHSCVHGYWLLARLLRRYPDLAQAREIRSLFAERISAANVAGEVAYLARPEARSFERPYGWGWLLALQSELEQHRDGDGRDAAETMRPLAQVFADRFRAFLPLCDYPIRTGVHSSMAFALRLAADYAEPNDPELFALMRDRVFAWFGDDRGAQAWEPSQDDFLSPTLMEAECMRRFMAPSAFASWFADFLPNAAYGAPETLFAPARVSDPNRWQDRPSRWLELRARVVLARDRFIARRGASGCAACTRRSATAHQCEPPPCRGRLYGRALAGDVCATGARGLARDREIQRRKAINAALDVIARIERTDAGRRSGEDEVAGLQLPPSRERGDDF
jgi:hypothetical protein